MSAYDDPRAQACETAYEFIRALLPGEGSVAAGAANVLENLAQSVEETMTRPLQRGDMVRYAKPVVRLDDDRWIRRRNEDSMVLYVDNAGPAWMQEPDDPLDFWSAPVDSLLVISKGMLLLTEAGELEA